MRGGELQVSFRVQVRRLGMAAEDLGRQTSQAPRFGALTTTARKVRDDQGKNYSDDSTRDRWRDAGPLRNGFHGRGAEALLHLIGADGFVLSGVDPGLYVIGEAVLLQLIKDAVHSTGMLLHHLAECVGYTMVFRGSSAGNGCQGVE